MRKTIRNQALAGILRLITADFNGKDWPAPDGHFAINYPIYDGYRIKRDQSVMDERPTLPIDLDKIHRYYEPAAEQPVEATGRVELTSEHSRWPTAINQTYLSLFRSIWPNSQLCVDPTSSFVPVAVFNEGSLVGVIMPFKH